MTDEREDLSFAAYGTAVRELAQQVADDGYRPDMILAIARGGLFVAGSLGYALGVKNLYVMNVEYYTGVDERLDVPVMLPPYVDFVETNAAQAPHGRRRIHRPELRHTELHIADAAAPVRPVVAIRRRRHAPTHAAHSGVPRGTREPQRHYLN